MLGHYCRLEARLDMKNASGGRSAPPQPWPPVRWREAGVHHPSALARKTHQRASVASPLVPRAASGEALAVERSVIAGFLTRPWPGKPFS